MEHEGLTQAELARVVGVQRQSVNVWLRRYSIEGDSGL
ncbi:MAG: helix-turn-helix domain-containing protein, partial [Geminicoccaceae bacterium]